MNSPLRKQCFPPADPSLLVSYDEAGGRLPFFSSPWLLPQPLPLKQAPRGAQTTRTAKIFPFSVHSSRREGGRQGEWAKKCLPRHECAADILTLFPIAKPNWYSRAAPPERVAISAPAGIRSASPLAAGIRRRAALTSRAAVRPECGCAGGAPSAPRSRPG